MLYIIYNMSGIKNMKAIETLLFKYLQLEADVGLWFRSLVYKLSVPLPFLENIRLILNALFRMKVKMAAV